MHTKLGVTLLRFWLILNLAKREAARALLVSASYEKARNSSMGSIEKVDAMSSSRRYSTILQKKEEPQQPHPQVFQVQIHQPRKSLTSSTDDVFSHVESEPISTAKSNTVQQTPRIKPESLQLR